MLYGLEPGLQKRFERHGAYEMFQEMKLVFQSHAHVERYETSDKYFAYKMEENSSASEHVLRMSGYYNRLNQVGVNLPDKIVIDKSSLVTHQVTRTLLWTIMCKGWQNYSQALRDVEIDEVRNQERASSVDG